MSALIICWSSADLQDQDYGLLVLSVQAHWLNALHWNSDAIYSLLHQHIPVSYELTLPLHG